LERVAPPKLLDIWQPNAFGFGDTVLSRLCLRVGPWRLFTTSGSRWIV
jgi:hypothetical protein